MAELEELAANLQGASQHVRAQAGHTQGVLGSLELIGARMALDVAAAGVSLANMVGDGYVMIGGELGLASGQRFAESAASSQGRINDAKHLYHYMAHEDGVAETAAAARQWGGRLLAGDREAANDLGSVSLGAVLGGFSSGRRLASSAADAAPKPGRVVWLVDEDVVKVRESSELPASAMRERGVATVQAETPTSDAIRARVLANIRASEAAREASNFGEHVVRSNQLAANRGANFATDELLAGHFKKHGKEFRSMSPQEYLQVGQSIIQNGQKITYFYEPANEIRTGYISFMRNSNKTGESLFGFVGTNKDGAITTIHVKPRTELFDLLGDSAQSKLKVFRTDTIGPVPQQGWKYPYTRP